MVAPIPHSNSRRRRPILTEFFVISLCVPLFLASQARISFLRKTGPDFSSTTGLGKFGSLVRQFATAGGLTSASSAISKSPIKSAESIVNDIHRNCDACSQICQGEPCRASDGWPREDG